MTAAETLRRAADIMRDRALGAERGPWYWEALGEKRYPQRVSSEGRCVIVAECFISPEHRPFEAEHIAAWHPGVALALADWLDLICEFVANMPDLDRDHIDYEPCDDYACQIKYAALAVARIYLGEATT